ncbi:PhzF family phenazine biosynthesis protein [Plantactinospora sp. GCM10030261]|uniref:PhzF family phenazine biosynthesis protein n=1 Tax=Plantactinospora sp. GCM10030261 TaxID=3273420 RepID=UPI00361C1F77
MAEPAVRIVDACLRDGRGGSPTAVVDESAWAAGRRHLIPPAERSQVPLRFGTSHAVFVTEPADGDPTRPVDLRFFTAEGELPACGHGTVAALTFLAGRRHREVRRHVGHRCQSQDMRYEFQVRVSGRTFVGHATPDGDRFRAAFDPGPVTVREPTSVEIDLVLAALGVRTDVVAPGACVASLGRARMLVPLDTPEAVAALAPDLGRLRAACDRFGLLGCYVYSRPAVHPCRNDRTHARRSGNVDAAGRLTARMFAPSIGVPEDIANANSTACLAAHLARQGVTDLTVDMGDALGSPASVTATARRVPTGVSILVGGVASTGRTG